MQIDITQALKDTENLLRDFIAATLEKALGSDWTAKCGVAPQRLEKWKGRKEEELKRQPGGVVEPRLIYYADFYDVRTILEKHWGKFSEALGDLGIMKVYLGELEKLRDPDAHRRELLPHQKHLAIGIAGEIRTRLIRYRSKLETSEDYFPRIESVRDSLGNIWIAGASPLPLLGPKHILRPDDVIDYVVTASDPMGEALHYAMVVAHGSSTWQTENTFSLRILGSHIGKQFVVGFKIKSSRAHHAESDCDDNVQFFYTVLPKK